MACQADRVMNLNVSNAYLVRVSEPLMVEAFERLPSIKCAMTIACGSGGQPTDFLHKIAPAAAARAPNSRLKR